MRFLLFLLSFPLILLFSSQSLHASSDNTIANLTPSSSCVGERNGKKICELFENGDPKSLPIGTEGEVVLAQLPQIIIFSIFIGVFIALFINSNVLYVTTKESDYLFYSGFILFFSIWMIANHGYFEYIVPSLALISTIKFFAFYMGSFSLILFTVTFLNLKEIYPKLFNLSSLSIGATILLFIPILLDGESKYSSGMILLNLTCLYLGIMSYSHKYAPSKYYLLAVGSYTFGLLIKIATIQGVIVCNFYTVEAHLIGFVLEMIFLLLALGYKVRLLQNERNDAISKTQIQEKMLFLKSRQASVGELVGNIAHQWREPLGEIGAIHTNLEATLLLKGSVSNEALSNFIRESYKIIRHLSDTIDVFYSFFKNKKSDKEEFDICEAITNIQQMVYYSLTVENIMLVYRCEEKMIVFWNRNEFANVLLNLILNAKDVLIERNIQNPIISIQVSKNDEKIIITIEDNGTGIKQEPIDKIFQSGVSSKEQGIGLGLFIVRTIIEQKMGGEISVKNSENGALFTLSIPQKSNEFKVENTPSSYTMEEDALERISKLEKKVAQQEETEKTLQKWADIFQHAQWGIAIDVGTSNTFELTNSAFNALYGYTSSELKNITLPDLFASESLPTLLQAQKEAFEKGYFVFEAVHTSKNGSTFPVSIELIVVKNDNGEILYHIVNIWDLTEKKEIVDALKTSEEAFRAMVENSPDVIMRYDRECHRTYINPKGLLLMGKPKEELLGKTPREFSPLPDLEEFEKAFLTVLNERKEVTIDGLFCTSDGEKRWGEQRIVPELNREGEVVSILVIGRDITELRKANEQLLLKEFALNKISETVFLIDEKSNFHYLNETAYQSLGYEEKELMQLNVISIDPNMSQEKWIEHWNDMKQLHSVSLLTHHQRKDGTVFPIEVSANYFEYKGIGYNLAVARDITERLEAEKRKDDEKMRLFFERQLVGMAITSPTKGWLHVNDKLCDMLGYTLEELQNMTWAEITHHDDLASDVEQFDKLLLGEIEDYMLEKRFVRKDKTIVYTNLAVSCVRNDDRSVNYVLALLEDITEQKRAYEALANKERELRALADSSPGMMGSFYLRPDGSVCMPYISPNILDLFGLQPQDVADDASSLMLLTHPDDLKLVEESIAESASTMSIWHTEYRINHPMKGERWMESNTKPELHPDGGIIWYGYIHDITERKKAEEKIKTLNSTLEQKVIERTTQLSKREREFRTLAENMPDFLVRYDSVGRRAYVNPPLCKYFALSSEELLGFTPEGKPLIGVPPELHEKVQFVLETAQKTELEIMNDIEGTKCWWNIIFVPEFDEEGNTSGVISIGHDITSIKESQFKIAEENEKFSKLFMSSPAAVSVTSLERNIYLEVNESFLSFTKYTREEVVGKSSADLQLFANVEERGEFFRRVLEEGVVRDFEFQYRAKDGTVGYGIAYASVLYINKEKCVLAHSYDINARKQLDLILTQL
jgi:PAS domain S-box-containing protein